MIGDAARRYLILIGTPNGRRLIGVGLLIASSAITVCATLLPAGSVRVTLSGAAFGALAVACIFLVSRKAR